MSENKRERKHYSPEQKVLIPRELLENRFEEKLKEREGKLREAKLKRIVVRNAS